MIIPALISMVIVPIYLLSEHTTVIIVGYIAIGLFAGGGMYGQIPAFLNERYPTEVRATASAFSYHVGAMFGLVNVVVALALGPEKRGMEMVPDLVVA